MVFPVSVGTFFSLLIDDNAPFPFDKYHTDNGDRETSITEWKAAAEGIGQTRELRFIKPLSFSMGPSKTRAIKAQLLKRFGEHGLVLSTSTRLEDIPNGDCFCVDDVFIVRATGAKQCTVEIRLELNFFKSTMWRKIIESTTITETSKWLKDYAEACLNFVTQGDVPQQPAAPVVEGLAGEDAMPDVTVAHPVNMSTVLRSVIAFILLTMCLFALWRWKTSTGASSSTVDSSAVPPQAPFFASGDFAVWKDRFDSIEEEMKRNKELIELQQTVIRELSAALETLRERQTDSCRRETSRLEEL